MSEERFETALITGASSGIGRAIALELAAKGTRVVLAARRRAELEELSREVRERGGRADVCELDVADTAATRETVARWDRDLGGFDLVLANAGVGGTEPAPKITWPAVERIVQVNVLGAMATLVPLIAPMVERGHGTLSAVTSLAGMRGLPSSAAYSASKAAVSTFLEARGDAVVAFPWQLAGAMTFAEKMPDALWRSVLGPVMARQRV